MLLLSPSVLAELDYQLPTWVGRGAEVALLGEVGRGTYRQEPFSEGGVAGCGVIERYADLDSGLADASSAVLANRHDTLDVLTPDGRHFRVLRGPRERPFPLLPADAAQRIGARDPGPLAY